MVESLDHAMNAAAVGIAEPDANAAIRSMSPTFFGSWSNGRSCPDVSHSCDYFVTTNGNVLCFSDDRQ
jgi:hypothetical protein